LAFHEPAGLAYSSSEAIIKSARQGDTTHYSLSFEHDPLDAQQFLTFLDRVAPYKGDADLYGVIGDWNVVDMVGKDTFNGKSESKRLVGIHEKMGTPWTEFMKSRGAFLQVLDDARIPIFGRVGVVPDGVEVFNSSKLRRIAQGQLLGEAGTKIAFDEAIQVLEEAGVEDAAKKFHTTLRVIVNRQRRRNRARTTNDPQEIAEGSKRKNVIYQLSLLLPPEKLEALINEKLTEMYGTYVAPDGTAYSFPHSQYTYSNEEFEDVMNDKQVVRQGNFEAEVTAFQRISPWQNEVEKFTLVTPGSVHQVAGSTVRPIITWSKDRSGQRKIDFTRNVEPLNGSLVYTDGIMGALAIAYHSPDITTSWPSTMSLGTGRVQKLGAAQVPVLALFPKYLNQLTNSPFIEAAEEAVA